MIENIRRLLGWYKNRDTVDPLATASAWQKELDTVRTVLRAQFPPGTDDAHVRAAALGYLYVLTLPDNLRAITIKAILSEAPHGEDEPSAA